MASAHAYPHIAFWWPELLHIVEGFRTQAGVRQRVVASFGRVDERNGKKLDPLIHGLQRALGRVPTSVPVPQYDTARLALLATQLQCRGAGARDGVQPPVRA